MLVHLRRSIILSVILFVVCGLAYPYLETGIARVLFPSQAAGSLAANNAGSNLLGQQWTGPKWFQGRPDTDDPMASGSSNLGPRSEVLVQDTEKQIALLKKEGIPPTNDLVTTSGSSLDPDISPAAAYDQAAAVAKANGLSISTVDHLIAAHVAGAQLGFLGAPYVNVLQLNQALAKAR